MGLSRLLNNEGSSLTAVLVTGSVMAIVLTTVAQLNVSTQRHAETMNARAEFHVLISQLGSLLQNERSCRLALGGAEPVSDNPPNPRAQNFVPNNNPQRIRILKGGTNESLFEIDNSAADRFGSLKLTELELIKTGDIDSSPGVKLYSAKLRIKVSAGSSTVGGKELGNEDINLSIKLGNGNKIVSCTSAVFYRTDGNAGFTHLPKCAPGEALYTSNGNLVRCVKVNCAPGQTRAAAFGPDGNAVCY